MAHGKLKSKENVFGTQKKGAEKTPGDFSRWHFKHFAGDFPGFLIYWDMMTWWLSEVWDRLGDLTSKRAGNRRLVKYCKSPNISLCIYIYYIQYMILTWIYTYIYNISLYIYISCEPTFGDLTEPHYKQWLWLRYSSNAGLDSGWWIFSICPDMLVRSIIPYRYKWLRICWYLPPTPYSPEN